MMLRMNKRQMPAYSQRGKTRIALMVFKSDIIPSDSCDLLIDHQIEQKCPSFHKDFANLEQEAQEKIFTLDGTKLDEHYHNNDIINLATESPTMASITDKDLMDSQQYKTSESHFSSDR